MAINRGNQTHASAKFSVNCNVVLSGSKRMTPQQQDDLMSVPTVRILIVDADDESNVLVDEEVNAKAFSTGSVGYGLQAKGCQFSTR